MLDFRPVGYVVGLLVFGLGLSMLLPMLWDSYAGNGHWFTFLESALITCTVGGLTALASANGVTDRLSIQQTFILTTVVWVASFTIFWCSSFLFRGDRCKPCGCFF
jgi:trk system potassium uptake protein TrkH